MPQAAHSVRRAGLAPPRADRASLLRIGGLTPMTTIDYPGQLAAVVYFQGCPWRCRYCHNGHLVEDHGPHATQTWSDVVALLRRRRGLLDAVVFSGGEPTAQRALHDALCTVGELGFLRGLHTNGAYPERLRTLLPELDWVGLDIKALAEDYAGVTGVAGSGARAWQSLSILLGADVAFDVRITVHDRLLPGDRLAELRKRLANLGVANPVVQVARNDRMLDPSLGPNAFDTA
jgi:pyruvate formate lyase activating enzyme